MDKKTKVQFKNLNTNGGSTNKTRVYHQEMMALTRRIDRIEAWMRKVEAKVGIKVDW